MAGPSPASASAAPLFRRVLEPLQKFFRFEAAGGVLLAVATIAALVWANSPWSDSYQSVFTLPLQVWIGQSARSFTLAHLINDGLMTIFFFVVGMEIKRELVVGELRTFNRAVLPAIAAMGGMIVPAVIYVALNHGTPAARGWAIPMATDIAFSLGLLTVLKRRVPWALIVFLTALAIFDDMGGIAVIALFYGQGIHWAGVLATVGLVAVLAVLARVHVRSGVVWTLAGAALWFTVHEAGIHAAISGVLLGILIPSASRHSGREILTELSTYVREVLAKHEDDALTSAEVLEIEERLEELEPPLNRFVHALHPYVAFGIVPLFALANAGLDLRGVSPSALLQPVPLGIALGLFAGKQLGIFAFTAAAVKLRLSPLPNGSRWLQLWGVSAVGGIGFTVSLFVATLAFAQDPQTLAQAKLGILAGSAASAVFGFLLLVRAPAARSQPEDSAAAGPSTT